MKCYLLLRGSHYVVHVPSVYVLIFRWNFRCVFERLIAPDNSFRVKVSIDKDIACGFMTKIKFCFALNNKVIFLLLISLSCHEANIPLFYTVLKSFVNYLIRSRHRHTYVHIYLWILCWAKLNYFKFYMLSIKFSYHKNLHISTFNKWNF